MLMFEILIILVLLSALTISHKKWHAPRTITDIAIICMVAISILLGAIHEFGWALIGLPLTTLLAYFSHQFIQENPPSIGLVTRWGRRQRGYIKERLVFAFPFLPFVEEILPIMTTPRTLEIVVNDVRCRANTTLSDTLNEPRSGGSVRVLVEMTYKPNPERLIEFLESDGLSTPESNEISEHSTEDGVREGSPKRNTGGYA